MRKQIPNVDGILLRAIISVLLALSLGAVKLNRDMGRLESKVDYLLARALIFDKGTNNSGNSPFWHFRNSGSGPDSTGNDRGTPPNSRLLQPAASDSASRIIQSDCEGCAVASDVAEGCYYTTGRNYTVCDGYGNGKIDPRRSQQSTGR